LLSFKAHKGWISGVQFLTKRDGLALDDPECGHLVLTSSNDKSIAIWDINKQQGLKMMTMIRDDENFIFFACRGNTKGKANTLQRYHPFW
jgi:WD40 repeat protein